MRAFRSASCVVGLAGLMLHCAFAATVPVGTGTIAFNPSGGTTCTEILATPADTGGGVLYSILDPGGVGTSDDVLIFDSPTLGGDGVIGIFSDTPEPTTVTLAGVVLIGLALLTRRLMRQKP